MWSSRTRWPEFRSRRTALLSIVAALAAGLGACGFEPLYGTRTSAAFSAELASIEIAPIKSRLGRLVRNVFHDGLTPRGAPAAPRFRLALEIAETTTPLLIQLDDTVTRFNLSLSASYTLTDLESGETVHQGGARTIGSYNVVESQFATVVAEQDAGAEAARELGDEIRTLLLIYFDRRVSGP